MHVVAQLPPEAEALAPLRAERLLDDRGLRPVQLLAVPAVQAHLDQGVGQAVRVKVRVRVSVSIRCYGLRVRFRLRLRVTLTKGSDRPLESAESRLVPWLGLGLTVYGCG